MQAQTGHIAEKSEESKTADKSAVIAVYDTHAEAEEAVRELQISGFTRNLTEFGKMVKIKEAENQITTLMMPSQLALDICNQHMLVNGEHGAICRALVAALAALGLASRE